MRRLVRLRPKLGRFWSRPSLLQSMQDVMNVLKFLDVRNMPVSPTWPKRCSPQNVYLGEEGEEPVFQYVPEKRLSPSVSGAGGAATPLHQSLLLLEESLESGAITGQFEQLPRRNPSLAISECHLPTNAAKNR